MVPSRRYLNLFLVAVILTAASCQQQKVSKMEMDLSSFGVESDNYPNIHITINFIADSSSCKKFYYASNHEDSTYELSKEDIKRIHDLVEDANLDKLKKGFKVNLSDRPTSIIKLYTDKGPVIIKDYGLKGDYPLQKLYQIAYNLGDNSQ